MRETAAAEVRRESQAGIQSCSVSDGFQHQSMSSECLSVSMRRLSVDVGISLVGAPLISQIFASRLVSCKAVNSMNIMVSIVRYCGNVGGCNVQHEKYI